MHLPLIAASDFWEFEVLPSKDWWAVAKFSYKRKKMTTYTDERYYHPLSIPALYRFQSAFNPTNIEKAEEETEAQITE